MKALQTSMHDDRTGRFGVSGAVPSAKASDDPCRPWQRSRREGVSEPVGFSVDRGSDGFEHLDVLGLEGSRGWPLVGAATGMNELHAHDGGAQRDDGELAQDMGRFDLTFF